MLVMFNFFKLPTGDKMNLCLNSNKDSLRKT